jgi:phosphoglycerate dehydrogenase-like enzyme
MKSFKKVAICSRSFSKNQILRNEVLENFEYVKFNDEGKNLKGDDLVNFLSDADYAITALEEIDDYVISRLPNLQLISKYGVGLDMIDTNSLEKHNVKLSWVGGVNKRAVSELVLSFILSILRNTFNVNLQLKNGIWEQKVGSNLSGKVVGIIGCGNIGKDLITILKPFNCKILVYDIVKYEEYYSQNNILSVDLDVLLTESDIVSVHVPLTPLTKYIINDDNIFLMKKTAILINTSRGGVVSEESVLKSLNNNNLFAAGFDVFENEPNVNLELLNSPGFYATSHIGGSSIEAILAMGRAAIEGLITESKN